jgi:microcystin-dependent protein
MAAPFVAEIRMFACNFAPTGWAQCNGQLLPISQNTALFSLLGTFYGGDGKSTFALPDLMDSVPLHQGSGAGLSQRFLGETGGAEYVSLLTSEIPAHNHNVGVFTVNGLLLGPTPTGVITQTTGGSMFNTLTPNVVMNPISLAPTGGSLPHNNMQPYLVVNYCIAMQGVFPPRS